jgi:hypothetical protein
MLDSTFGIAVRYTTSPNHHQPRSQSAWFQGNRNGTGHIRIVFDQDGARAQSNPQVWFLEQRVDRTGQVPWAAAPRIRFPCRVHGSRQNFQSVSGGSIGLLSFRKNSSPSGAGIVLKVRGDAPRLKNACRLSNVQSAQLGSQRVSAKPKAPRPKFCSMNRRMLPKSCRFGFTYPFGV